MKLLVWMNALALTLASCGDIKRDHNTDPEQDSVASDTVVDLPEDDSTMLLTSNEEEYDYGEEFKLENYLVEKKDTTDLQEISGSVALIVFPTEEQINEMQEDYGEDNFYTVADDANYYQASAIGLIDSLQVETVNASSRFVQFTGNDKTWMLDLRGRKTAPWNIIFFKENKEPLIVPAVELDIPKIREYFEL